MTFYRKAHLQAEDFVNLVEGTRLPAKVMTHLEACERCRTTWHSMRSTHAEVTAMESDIPEPDWERFRSSVRDELLSRSIQRQTQVRRWTGWSVRPAVAWAMSVCLAVGLTTITVMWKIEGPGNLPASTPVPVVRVEPAPVDPNAEVIEAGPERSLFEDVVSLGEDQQEEFRQLLEAQ